MIRTLLLVMFLIASASINAQVLQKSDRYISRLQSEEIRNQYNVTNIAWGFLPLSNLETRLPNYISEASQIKNEGRVFHGRIEFDAGWKIFADYCDSTGHVYAEETCKTIELNDFEYPWFAGSTFGSYKPYWISSHSPVFIAFLKYQIDKTLEAPVNVLMVDAQTSSALAAATFGKGDFSSHCILAFRIFLEVNYSTSALDLMGISDINTFDYRHFLIDKGIVTDSIYLARVKKHWQTPVPLYNEYRLFQNQAVNALTKEIADYARSKNPNIIFGTSSPPQDPSRATLLTEVDYFMLEADMVMSTYTRELVLTYKLAESLGKPVVLTALPNYWKDMIEGILDEEYGLQWIVEAYANGANFIFPSYQWAHGSDNFVPSIDYTFLSSFIAEKFTFFDNYEAIKGKVALVQSWKGNRNYNREANEIANALTHYNIPFDLIIAGDEYLPSTPSFELLNSYEKVIVSANSYNWYLSKDETIKSNLDKLGNKLFKWIKGSSFTNIAPTKNNLSTQLSLYQNGIGADSNITVLPRLIDSNSPFILHLVNKEYNTQTRTFKEFNNIELRLNESTFDQKVLAAKLHLPDQPAKELSVRIENDTIVISNINNLGLYGIIELIHSGQNLSSIEETEQYWLEDYILHPNPAGDVINIKGSVSNWRIIEIHSGRTILQGDTDKINIEFLDPGMYLLNNENKRILKFIKQ